MSCPSPLPRNGMHTQRADVPTPTSNLPGFRTLFSDRFVWFPFRVRGISPGLQSEVNLYRKYKDFEEAGWDIMSGVRILSLALHPPLDLIACAGQHPTLERGHALHRRPRGGQGA